MKIAHVVSTFPPDIGGMGQVAKNEVVELARRGHDVTVFTLAYPESKYFDGQDSYKVIRSKPLISSGAAGVIPKLRNQLRLFDVVHLHYPFYGSAELVWWSGVPYVATYHMDAAPVKGGQKIVKGVYDRLLACRILQKARRVILVDQNHSFQFKKNLYPEQVATVPNGINMEVFKPGSTERKPHFLFVGNFLPVKGLPLLLKAWKEVPEAELTIVGGGYREHAYRKEAESLGIAHRVHWLGPCYDETKLASLYAEAAALILPSTSESFSLVAAEALATGCPVIGSDLPGIKDRVIEDETGFLFTPGSKESLAEAVQKMIALAPEQRKRLGENGRDLIGMKYNLNKHVDALEMIYRSVV